MVDVAREPLVRPFGLDTLVAVRHEVRTYADAAGLLDIRLYKFVVAVNEIMTNAVHHGGGAGRLRLWHDDERLYCEVSDNGPGIPGGRGNGEHRPQPGTIGGWGLWLTREICEKVRIATGRGGTQVSLQYPLRD